MLKRLLSALPFSVTLVVVSYAYQSPYAVPDPGSTPRYDLTVKIVPEAHRLEATGTARFPASDAPRESLKLRLSKLMTDFRAEVLQPDVGAAVLERGEAAGENTSWTLRPARPFPAGQPILLSLSYAGGEGSSFIFYLGPEASFALGANPGTAWYPYLNQNKAVGTLRFSVPAGFTVFATGRRRSSPEEESQGLFRYELDYPAVLGFAAGRYTVVRRQGIVPVSAYLLHPRQNFDAYLDGCAKILDLFARRFGPYPYGEFALIEIPTEKAAQAGFGGATIASSVLATSQALDKPFNLAYYAHEIGHQWWGNLVGRAGPRGDFMLDEGMAQFASLQAVDAIEGADAAEQFRRTGYPGFYPYRDSGLGYLRLAAAGLDHRLSDLPDNYASFWLAYSKAFLVLDLLSRTVGREQFSRTLRGITEQYAFKSITWEQFLQSVEAGSGRSLKRFYAQWFDQTGAPDWELKWTQEGSTLRGSITQNPPYYETEVGIEVEGDGCLRHTRRVIIRGPRTEFVWPVDCRARAVILDPHFLVPHWTPEYRAEATAQLHYTRAYVTWREGQVSQAQSEYLEGLQRIPSPDLYSVRFMLEQGLAQLLMSQKKWGEARAHLEMALASPTRFSDELPRTYLNLATVARELNDEVLLRRSVDAAVSADAAVNYSTGAANDARTLLLNFKH